MSIGGHTAHRRLSDFCVMSPENSQSAPALASKRTLDVVKGHVVPRDCILPAVRMSGMLVHRRKLLVELGDERLDCGLQLSR